MVLGGEKSNDYGKDDLSARNILRSLRGYGMGGQGNWWWFHMVYNKRDIMIIHLKNFVEMVGGNFNWSMIKDKHTNMLGIVTILMGFVLGGWFIKLTWLGWMWLGYCVL